MRGSWDSWPFRAKLVAQNISKSSHYLLSYFVEKIGSNFILVFI